MNDEVQELMEAFNSLGPEKSAHLIFKLMCEDPSFFSEPCRIAMSKLEMPFVIKMLSTYANLIQEHYGPSEIH